VLIEQLKELFEESRKTYGSRRLKRKLAEKNIHVSRRRIGRLMRKAGLFCKTKRRFKATTNSRHNKTIAPNLLDRQFSVLQPDRYYVGDITYIATQKGWLYLAVVIDLFSRQVVGWSMDKRMKAKLVNDALLMAIWKRGPQDGLDTNLTNVKPPALLGDYQSLAISGFIESILIYEPLKVQKIRKQTMKVQEILNHTVFECKYHIVWIPKYRKKALFKDLTSFSGSCSG